MNTTQLINNHINYYKKIQIIDILKLLHQKNFGPGHLLKDPKKAKEMFCLELSTLQSTQRQNYIEPIGDKYTRIYLEANINKSVLFDMFVKSAKTIEQKDEFFLQDVEQFKNMALFDLNEINKAVQKWEKDKAPFSHSAVYREVYKPAYRVVKSSFLEQFPKA